MDGNRPIADFGFRISDLRPTVNPQSPGTEKKQQVAHDFESVLLTRLFDQVQQSMGKWDLEEDGTSQQVQGLFWFYLAREVADQGGVGLWKDVYQQLQQMDGVPNPTDVLNEEL